MRRSDYLRPQSLVFGFGATGGLAFWIARRIRRYEIAERSMWPELEPGDYTIAVRFDPAMQAIRRGDVVIYADPVRPGFELVKRVVGLPGERVMIVDGHIEIDGVVISDPWATGPTTPDAQWTLGDEIVVLGDHRTVSAGDSRTIGPIPRDAVTSRIVGRYWPFNRIGRVRRV